MSVLTVFPPLPLPEEMRAWDQGAVDLGLPEMVLMENAARAALDVLRTCQPELAGKRVWLFMGGGNNGGDAACLARHLLDQECIPLVLHIKPLKAYTGACGRHVRLSRAAGVAFRPLRTFSLPKENPPDMVIDGLLGTGFSGTLRADMLAHVRTINALAARSFVLALDAPSGLDGRTGRPGPEAVRAAATACFAAGKPGLFLPHARPWTGRVHVRDIGIPRRVRKSAPCSWLLADGHCLNALAPLPDASYKQTFGHVLVAGGSPGYEGAAHLAARAALRCGAGLVTAAAPAASLGSLRNGWAEIMTLEMPGSPHCWPPRLPTSLVDTAKKSTALVIGPGMGRSPEAAKFLELVLDIPHRPPTVFDADALILLSTSPRLLARITPADVLTPHPGEAAALLGESTAQIQADRPAALRRLCGLCKGVVVLKGAGSLVGQSASPVLLCPYDIPQLAVGGSGDVLAGCVGGILASRGALFRENRFLHPGVSRTQAAAGAAVALHALAGLWLAARYPVRGNTPSALADALPLVMGRYAAAQPCGDELPWPSSH